MKNMLSICIFGKDAGLCINECIESALNVTQRAIYLDLGSTDDSLSLAEKKGIHAEKIDPASINPDELLKNTSIGEWILFLKPNEKIEIQSPDQLTKAFTNKKINGYSLIVTKNIEPAVLESFQWLKKNNQYKHVGNEAAVTTIEIRLVRRKHFKEFFQLLISWSKDDIFPFESKMLNGIRILPCTINVREEEEDSTVVRERQIKYLKGELSCDLDEDEGLYELSDDYIIYSVLTRDDIARYYKGLSLGFGGERMYLTMIHYLAELGRFEEARNFYEAWKEKWGFFDTPEPYRVAGIIYANLFETENAVSCFKSYVAQAPEDHLGSSLSLLAKSLLLQGDKDEAVSCLRRALAVRNDPFDHMLVETLEKDNWKPITLSVCMIARDEAPYIERAIKSVSQIADEIIVVDTGSTDNTTEILQQYDVKLLETEWENDFSRARNLGLQTARGDYILCLDGDEFIDPRERIKLALAKHILPRDKNIAYRIMIEEEDEEEGMNVMLRLPKLDKPEYPVRLFPGGKDIFFEGTAFESVDNSVAAQGIKIEWNDIYKITHSKSDRILRNRRKEMAVRKMYDSLTDPDLALKGVLYFLKIEQPAIALAWLKKTDIDNPVLLSKFISFYSMIGHTKDFKSIIDQALEKFPDSPEMNLAKAELNFAEGNYDEISHTLNNHMETIKATLEREDMAKACYLYGMALLETGHLEEGIPYVIESREEDSWNIRYKIGGIYALARGDSWEGVIGAVDEVLMEENLDISMTINDFADLGILFSTLHRHFLNSNRIEAALLCDKITENIIVHKLTSESEIDKVNAFINTSGNTEVRANA